LILRVFAILLAAACLALPVAAQSFESSPSLLLNGQRLRRLKRDRERQTVRWTNFENRVNSVADSPERGFELALYYLITSDQARGKQAVAWASAHPCDRRQVALVRDWVGKSSEQSLTDGANPLHPCNSDRPVTAMSLRDDAFSALAGGGNAARVLEAAHHWLPEMKTAGFMRDSQSLYAAFELIYALRSSERVDLREDDTHFFSELPLQFLLAMKPHTLEHPDWKMHAAALVLVSLDPNLGASQYLQGWAVEERHMIREGPGVAYELLWADPYLPGVGYQNMDTWIYDRDMRLLARSSWEETSCYIELSAAGIEDENCPAGWRDRATTFGHLHLIPMLQECIDLPRVNTNETVLVWKLKPNQRMVMGSGKQRVFGDADSLGVWRPGATAEGKACLASPR
jgi:hypothetical protein